MKRSKSRIAVLVLLVATIIYAVAFIQSVQAYNSWKTQKFLEWCEMMGVSPDSKFADFGPHYPPFLASNFGGSYMASTIALMLIWMFATPFIITKKWDGRLAAFFLIAAISIPCFIVAVRAEEPPIHIDILCCCDEEFDGGIIWVPNPPVGALPVPSKIWAETVTAWVSEDYLDEFNIELHWHYWTVFESDDGIGNTHNMLYAGKDAIGWRWNMAYDGENMELLCVFSQQSLDGLGLSYPWERMMVVTAMYPLGKLIKHEIGHQFYCDHCDIASCYMSEQYIPNTHYYCTTHSSVIMANRELLVQPLLSLIHVYGCGTVDLSPAWEYHCTVSPLDMNCYYYNYDEVVTATATASPYFEFCGWWLDGVRKSNIPITFTMDSDHTLIAEFQYIPGLGGGGGTCPTLFVWNGTAYVEEGVLDIHAYSDVTVHHWIQNTLALENNVYNLQLRELDNNTSHIDQVKLYVVDYEGERHLCPLTYAYHNLLGKVKHTIRFDDDSRVDLKPTEMIDLKFALSTPYGETAYFIFEINGYNAKNPTFK